MKDRVPTYPGRTKITREDGTVEYVTLERADAPLEEGTPLNKGTLLDDDTCFILDLPSTATPNEALLKLGLGTGKFGYSFAITTPGGRPIAGAAITGDITNITGGSLTTDSSGRALGVSTSRSIYITVNSNCSDINQFSSTITSTGIITYVPIQLSRYTGISRFYYSSTNIRVSPDVMSIRASLCGGGGNGGNGAYTWYKGYEDNFWFGSGGGGGGGGYVTNGMIQVSPYQSISLIVASSNGSSMCGNLSANGGGLGGNGIATTSGPGNRNQVPGSGGTGNGNGGKGANGAQNSPAQASAESGSAPAQKLLYPSEMIVGGGGGGGSAFSSSGGTSYNNYGSGGSGGGVSISGASNGSSGRQGVIGLQVVFKENT